MAWFEDWFCTPYYALLYGHRDAAEAAAWVDAIITGTGLRPGDRVLDMACGRGRHASHFIARGIHVTGIDLSAASIEEARKVAPAGEFHVHDIRVPVPGQKFTTVVCLFTSLGYSNDRRDDEMAVGSAAHVLQPGGYFVLDLFNGERVERSLVNEESFCTGDVQFAVKRRMEDGEIIKRIEVDDHGQHCTFEERVHAWRMGEVRAMVERAGLVIEAITDGPVPAPFDPSRSDRIVVWAKKP